MARRHPQGNFLFSLYHFFVVLPDRLYPFRTEIQGRWVRGVRSYNKRLAAAYKHYGQGHYGYALTLYRQAFHLAGSLIVIALSSFLASGLVLVAAILGIGYQEFFFQRRIYRQLWRKGVFDWLVWSLPIGVYFWTQLR